MNKNFVKLIDGYYVNLNKVDAIDLDGTCIHFNDYRGILYGTYDVAQEDVPKVLKFLGREEKENESAKNV